MRMSEVRPTAIEAARKVRDRVARSRAVRDSVELIQRTVLPENPDTRRRRTAVAGVCLAGLVGAAYALSKSLLWAVLIVVVAMAVVIMPGFLMASMVLEALARRRAAKKPPD